MGQHMTQGLPVRQLSQIGDMKRATICAMEVLSISQTGAAYDVYKILVVVLEILNKKKKKGLYSMGVETSDDLQLNSLYSRMAFRNRMTENLAMAASHKDSRADKMNVLYESAARREETAASESENFLYNM